MAENRFRLQVKFWLDLHKTDESELADLIAELKAQRTFSRVVRDGIRLMVDLWRGNIDVLLALFPWVEEAFYERFAERQPASDIALSKQLARLERLLLEQGNVPIAAVDKAAFEEKQRGPKPLAVPTIAGQLPDEDEPVALVVKKATSDGKSAQNFLESAFNLLG